MPDKYIFLFEEQLFGGCFESYFMPSEDFFGFEIFKPD
jgi:hypothetical protein